MVNITSSGYKAAIVVQAEKKGLDFAHKIHIQSEPGVWKVKKTTSTKAGKKALFHSCHDDPYLDDRHVPQQSGLHTQQHKDHRGIGPHH